MKTLALSDKMLDVVARRFRVLGEPCRLRILQTLEAGELSVNEIVEQLDGNQPNISKHLQTLFDAGLVSRRKEGTSVQYAIADPMVFKLCELVCKNETHRQRRELEQMAAEMRRSTR